MKSPTHYLILFYAKLLIIIGVKQTIETNGHEIVLVIKEKLCEVTSTRYFLRQHDSRMWIYLFFYQVKVKKKVTQAYFPGTILL